VGESSEWRYDVFLKLGELFERRYCLLKRLCV
jgi:hypothetical protein